jgi:nicotinamidase/pyrazinamidase
VDAFLIVDFQNDFTPGGALAVAGGDEIAAPIDRLLDRFGLVVATRDWHPADHGSFRSVEPHPALWRGSDPPATWPVHCVQGSPGAELHPALDRERVDLVLDKGRDATSPGYSAFEDTGLAELLRRRGVDRVYVAGLATDYCVRQTVLDARRNGLTVVVVTDAVRGVEAEPGDTARALAEMREAGAALEDADEVERSHPRPAGEPAERDPGAAQG